MSLTGMSYAARACTFIKSLHMCSGAYRYSYINKPYLPPSSSPVGLIGLRVELLLAKLQKYQCLQYILTFLNMFLLRARTQVECIFLLSCIC